MSAVPGNLKYSTDHEWVKIEGGKAVIGITAFACESLGDIVFVDLPKAGDALKSGATFGAVESTKAVSDLFAPLSGRVVRANQEAIDAPETLNVDPYDKGWLVEIELSDPAETAALLDAAAYTKHLETAGH